MKTKIKEQQIVCSVYEMMEYGVVYVTSYVWSTKEKLKCRVQL